MVGIGLLRVASFWEVSIVISTLTTPIMDTKYNKGWKEGGVSAGSVEVDSPKEGRVKKEQEDSLINVREDNCWM